MNLNHLAAQLAQLRSSSLLEIIPTQSPLLIAQLLQDPDPVTRDQRVNERGWGGLTPLHKACMRGQTDIVQLLLDAGAQLDAPNEGGETPFHYAARRGNPVVMEVLMRAGADMRRVDTKGRSAVHHAAQSGSVYALLWLESNLPDISFSRPDTAGGCSPLLLACQNGHREVVKFLLNPPLPPHTLPQNAASCTAARCSVSLTDAGGNTCLHAAIEAGHEALLYPIIMSQGGAGFKLLHVPNRVGHTPLDLYRTLSDKVKDRVGSTGAEIMLGMAGDMRNLKFTMMCMRSWIFFAPFGIYLAGLLMMKFLVPAHDSIIMLLASVIAFIFLRFQKHRTTDLSHLPSPAFAGAFLAGFVHTTAAFYLSVWPRMEGHWQLAMPLLGTAVLFLVVCFTLLYAGLVLRDPGTPQWDDIAKNPTTGDRLNFAEFLRARVVQDQSAPVEAYCVPCQLPPQHLRVKHCKLCEQCYVDMDHHCLFLMRCIAGRNQRFFVLLILVTNLAIATFLISAGLEFHTICWRPQVGLEWHLISCALSSDPWVFTMAFFNLISLVWGVCLLKIQLGVIAEGTTTYFRYRRPVIRLRRSERWMNVICYIVRGRFYKRPQETPMTCIPLV